MDEAHLGSIGDKHLAVAADAERAVGYLAGQAVDDGIEVGAIGGATAGDGATLAMVIDGARLVVELAYHLLESADHVAAVDDERNQVGEPLGHFIVLFLASFFGTLRSLALSLALLAHDRPRSEMFRLSRRGSAVAEARIPRRLRRPHVAMQERR